MPEPVLDADHGAPVYSSEMVAVQAPPEIVWDAIASITAPTPQRRVEPGRLLAWVGKARGISSITVYRLVENDGHTDVVLEESWDGTLPRLFRASLQRTLDKAVHHGLQALKAEAEGRADPVLAVAV